MSIPFLRWGILGTGNIAGKFAKDLVKLGDRARLVAVGSRDRTSAETFRDAHGADYAFGSYAEVLACAEVDAVYISLPNHLHREWSIAASKAGQHVLCEKPAGMVAAEVAEMTAAAKQADRFWMEAFAYRCHPRYARLAEIIANDLLGEVRLAHATFCFDGSTMGRGRLWDPAMGGGALMDVGVYPVSFLRLAARFAGHGEPDFAQATGLIRGGVDHVSGGILGFGGALTGTWQTAIACTTPTVASLHGSKGQIEIRAPWRCDEPTFILRRVGRPEEAIIVDDGESNYGREALTVARFAEAGQAPACTWQDSLDQARLIDRLRAQMGVRWPNEA